MNQSLYLNFIKIFKTFIHWLKQQNEWTRVHHESKNLNVTRIVERENFNDISDTNSYTQNLVIGEY